MGDAEVRATLLLKMQRNGMAKVEELEAARRKESNGNGNAGMAVVAANGSPPNIFQW